MEAVAGGFSKIPNVILPNIALKLAILTILHARQLKAACVMCFFYPLLTCEGPFPNCNHDTSIIVPQTCLQAIEGSLSQLPHNYTFSHAGPPKAACLIHTFLLCSRHSIHHSQIPTKHCPTSIHTRPPKAAHPKFLPFYF